MDCDDNDARPDRELTWTSLLRTLNTTLIERPLFLAFLISSIVNNWEKPLIWNLLNYYMSKLASCHVVASPRKWVCFFYHLPLFWNSRHGFIHKLWTFHIFPNQVFYLSLYFIHSNPSSRSSLTWSLLSSL